MKRFKFISSDFDEDELERLAKSPASGEDDDDDDHDEEGIDLVDDYEYPDLVKELNLDEEEDDDFDDDE